MLFVLVSHAHRNGTATARCSPFGPFISEDKPTALYDMPMVTAPIMIHTRPNALRTYDRCLHSSNVY